MGASVTETGVHIRVDSRAAIPVELRLSSGRILNGVTDELGSLTLNPDLDALFASSDSGAATVTANGHSIEVDLAPLIAAQAAAYPEEWSVMLRARDERHARADQAITFIGPIYRDKTREPLVEQCVPTGTEVCFDGVDNDCSGRYDDKLCGYQSGVLQFTASWKGDDDLDLHVVGPDNIEVSQDQPVSDQTRLRLDHNCRGTVDGKPDCPEGNVENVYVPATHAPSSGTYQAWIEVDRVSEGRRRDTIPVTFSGRIGTHQWQMLVKLAPIPGASYQVAFPLGADQDRDLIVDEQDACPTIPGCWFDEVASRGCGDSDHDRVPDSVDACPRQAGVNREDAKEHGCPLIFGNAWVTNNGVQINSRIEFAFGKAELLPAAKRIVGDVARALAAHPAQTESIAVDGHTDEVGTEHDNLTLSQDRANAVLAELVRLGVPESKLIPRGFGETQPRATNETGPGRAANRRVEVLVLKPRGNVSTCWSKP